MKRYPKTTNERAIAFRKSTSLAFYQILRSADQSVNSLCFYEIFHKIILTLTWYFPGTLGTFTSLVAQCALQSDHVQHGYAQHTCSNQLLRGSILAECMWGSRCLYDNICSSLSLCKIKAIAMKPGSVNLGGQILRSYTPTEAFYLRQDSIFPKR